MKLETVEELAQQAKLEYNHWLALREHGCNDPSWPDGVNMNLTRNHIIYYKERIEELISSQGLLFAPDGIDVPTPPEVDNNFMARRDDPRKNVRPIGDTDSFVYDKPAIA